MGDSIKLKIVISCVNFTEGGPLSVAYDCLTSEILDNPLIDVTVLVHKKSLFNKFDGKFAFLEYPEIKTSWKKRLNFEFKESKELSLNLKPDIWISLHDISANVICPMQVVYCHNPSPFYKTSLKDGMYDYKFFLFSIFYKFLYKINIKRNKFVIVQQNWLRKKFEKMYGVPTIVAYPSIELASIENTNSSKYENNEIATFFYPSFPRIFKNFEVLFDAVILLSKIRSDFQLLVTIDGTQNKFGNKLYEKYKHCSQIKFIGKQTREQVYSIFKSCTALIFPSKLETWGLPLTEAKSFNKPIIASDLEYARENIQDYKKVKFFDPNNAKQLANYMEQMLDGKLTFDTNILPIPDQPFFKNWDGLLKFLITENKKLL